MAEFQYRANGLALAGQLSQPSNETLLAQAACVLTPIGGVGSAELLDFTSATPKAVSFTRAATYVSGALDADQVHRTSVRVTIEGLDVADGLVTADRIEAVLASDHAVGTLEPNITPTFAAVGLKVLGQPFTPRFQNILRDHTSVSALSSTLKKKGAPALADPGGKALSAALAGKWSRTSTFQSWQATDPGIAAEPGGGACGLRIPGRGTLFLGDYLISTDSRRFTVLRVELEGSFEGTIVVAYLETNGHWYP